MEDLDINSEAALGWVAGFFCGEGSVVIGRSTGYEGWSQMAQKNREPLDLIHKILAAHNVETTEPRYEESGRFFVLRFRNAKGSEFLQLILPYPIGVKHRKRAEIYLRMFPPGERYVRRRAQRDAIFAEWLQLRIDELQERGSTNGS